MTMFLNGVKRHSPLNQLSPIEISSPSIDLGEIPKQRVGATLLDNFLNESSVPSPTPVVSAMDAAEEFLAVQDRDTLVKQLMTQGALTYKQIFADIHAKGLMKTYDPVYFRKIREELGLVRPGPKPGTVKSKKKQITLPVTVEKQPKRQDFIEKQREAIAHPMFAAGRNMREVFDSLKAAGLMNSYNPVILKRLKVPSIAEGSAKMSKQNKAIKVKKLVQVIKAKTPPEGRTDFLKQALERRQRQMLEVMREHGISKFEMSATGESTITLAEVVSFSV